MWEMQVLQEQKPAHVPNPISLRVGLVLIVLKGCDQPNI
jgi:hypothetical protein